MSRRHSLLSTICAIATFVSLLIAYYSPLAFTHRGVNKLLDHMNKVAMRIRQSGPASFLGVEQTELH